MAKQKLWLITAVLVLAAGATLLWDRKNAGSGGEARVGRYLVEPGTDLERIDLKKGDKTLALVRDAQKTWRLGDANGFPADATRVAQLVDALMRTKIDTAVDAKPEAMAELGFGDGATTVTATAAGKALPLVTLAGPRKNGGQYVGLGATDRAFLVALAVSAEPDAGPWELKTLLDLAKDEVKSVSFGGTTPVTLSREKKEDALAVQGLAANEKEKPAAKAVETTPTGLAFTKRYDKSNEEAKSALATPTTVTVTTFAGKTYVFKVGSVGDATKKWFLSIEGDGVAPELKGLMDSWWFEIPESTAQRFTKGRPDFIEASAG